MKLFGTSGIRRLYDAELLRLALNVGMAVGSRYRRVIIGRDTRTSGDAMKHALMAGLAAGGARCFDAGIVPTPTVAYSARNFDAGIMITASHNPPEYNGIKFIKPDGSAFDRAEENYIEECVSRNSFSSVTWDAIESGNTYTEAIERHIQAIMRKLPEKVTTRVALDCGNAAASVITPLLLKRMGCDVINPFGTVSGFFPRGMEPVETNLHGLMKLVKETGADVGIAHDGDADRMMAVDDKGRFISGDKLLAIFARTLGARKVVTTIDASMIIEEMGFDVIRTEVGDPAVSVALRNGGEFGGEPSGSWMFPALSLCPDGIFAAALVSVIAGSRKLSELADDIPSYPIIRGSIESHNMDKQNLQQSISGLKPAAINTIDGIRAQFQEGWLLVRPSGTEPKIRITAEARDEQQARRLYDAGIDAIKQSTQTREEIS